jgi:hypothetical protein
MGGGGRSQRLAEDRSYVRWLLGTRTKFGSCLPQAGNARGRRSTSSPCRLAAPHGAGSSGAWDRSACIGMAMEHGVCSAL